MDERGEAAAERHHELETLAASGWKGVMPLTDCWCWRSGNGEGDMYGRQTEKGKDVGLEKGEEVVPAGHGVEVG